MNELFNFLVGAPCIFLIFYVLYYIGRRLEWEDTSSMGVVEKVAINIVIGLTLFLQLALCLPLLYGAFYLTLYLGRAIIGAF